MKQTCYDNYPFLWHSGITQEPPPNSESVNEYYADMSVWKQEEFRQKEGADIVEGERLAGEEEIARRDVDPIIFDPNLLL